MATTSYDPIETAVYERNRARDELMKLEREKADMDRRMAQRIADAKTRLNKAKNHVVELTREREAARQG